MNPKISHITAVALELGRVEPFVIASGISTSSPNVIVRVETADGLVGYGNACPNGVTCENTNSILADLRVVARRLKGVDCMMLEHINAKACEFMRPAARAGLNIALFDLIGKYVSLPVYRLLGGSKSRMMTDITIGIMSLDETVARARKYKLAGFKALKLKVGLEVEEDIRRVAAVREEVGDKIMLWADGNRGYSVKDAVRFCRAIERYELAFVEQPVATPDELKKVRKLSPVPIMADENVITPQDAFKIASDGSADMINIKLMKSGGLTDGLRINAIAEAAGMKCMVGCMGESVVSIAAGLHLALAAKNIVFADLDSHFELKKDCATGGVTFENGYLLPHDRPGFGFEIMPNLRSLRFSL